MKKIDQNEMDQEIIDGGEEELELQTLIKRKLKGQLFIANYTEQRLIEEVNDYRLVLEVCSSEKEFQNLLIDSKRRIEKFYGPKTFFGVTYEKTATGAFSGTKIFCDIIENVPLGCFWIQIKGIRFCEKEVKLRLRFVRMLDEGTVKRQFKAPDVKAITASVTDTVQKIKWSEVGASWMDSISNGSKEVLLLKPNFQSLVKVFRFIVFLVISIIVMLFKFVHSVGEFTIRLLSEISRLIMAITPLVKVVTDMISKIIGGFIVFLAMVWRDSIGSGRARNKYPNLVHPHPAIGAVPFTPTRPDQNARWQFLHGTTPPSSSSHIKQS